MADELAVSDPIDTLVRAASRNVNPRTFGDLTLEAFDDLMKVNLNGAFTPCVPHCRSCVKAPATS